MEETVAQLYVDNISSVVYAYRLRKPE